MFCRKCGELLSDGGEQCPKCGTAVIKCSQCGAVLSEGQLFCPTCGQQVAVPDTRKKRGPILIGAIATVAVLIVVVVAVNLNSGPKFQKIYDEYCDPLWASIGADGSYLSIDTNPTNRDGAGLAFPEAYTAIEEVNAALKLPESLIKDMGATSSMDGKQTETYDKVVVSWKYHPDTGLEVTYKKK